VGGRGEALNGALALLGKYSGCSGQLAGAEAQLGDVGGYINSHSYKTLPCPLPGTN